MTRDTVVARLDTLQGEMEKATDELGKLRPRVQFLEQTMLRLDGALTVLHELLDAPAVLPPAHTPQREAVPRRPDAEFSPSWHTPVAP